MYELSEYLSRRYPDVYRVERKPKEKDDYGWYNEGQIHTIEIVPLGVTYDLDRDDPMTVSGILLVSLIHLRSFLMTSCLPVNKTTLH